MATIITRSGKGAPLTNAEVDANFTNLNTDKAETSSLAPVATSGAYSDLSGLPSLGTASAADTTDFVSQTSATGAAEIPVGTEAQRPTPASGQLRFNNETTQFEGYNGTAWGSIGGGATGGGGDQVFIQNDQVVTTNYTIPADQNAMTTGPIDINPGVVVTISTGARWVII